MLCLRNRLMLLLAVGAAITAFLPAQPLDSQGASLPDATRRAIESQIEKAEGKRGRFGLLVQDLDSGEVLLSHRADEALAPASNMKLVTTVAALELLGADFEYVTRVMGRGAAADGAWQGDLCLVGGGDPNLSGRFYNNDPLALFKAWAAQLAAKGIARVTGDLQFDTSLFGGEAYCEGWPKDDQYTKWYCAEVSALAFNDNCVGLRVLPGQADKPGQVELVPPTAYAGIVNQTQTRAGRKAAEIGILRPRDQNTITVKGTVYEKSSWGYTTDVTVHDPAQYAATVFRETLQACGIRVEGNVVSTVLTADRLPGYSVLVEHRSKLSQALVPINTNSQNLHAEMLLRMLGVAYAGKGTFKTGCAAVQEFLTNEGLWTADMRVLDGSGLARDDRVSARLLATLLARTAGKPHFEAFRASLAVAGETGTLDDRLNDPATKGKVFAKTGYINGVRALSGYILAGKRRYAFSMLMNDCLYTRETQDEIVKLLARAGT